MTIFDKSVQSVKFVNTITFKTKNDQLMKLYRHFLLLGTAIGLMMPGCTQDEEKLIDTGDELTIQASAREITLKEADAGKEALKLTWTPASDYGLEEDVYYTLEIARADADYSEGLRRDMGKSALSISWTTEGLNDLLTDVLGASSGTMTKYKAMVTATIYGRDDLTQTAETEFSAAAFTPSPYTLFIDGDALGSPAAVMMTRENPGRFSWQGALKEGSVVFRTSDESDWPAYGAGTEEGVLAYYSEDPGTDVSIKIGQIGEYDITADLVDLTYTVRYSEAPVPEMPENRRKGPPLFCPGPSVKDIILCLCEETVSHQHFLHLVLYLLHASEALVTVNGILHFLYHRPDQPHIGIPSGTPETLAYRNCYFPAVVLLLRSVSLKYLHRFSVLCLSASLLLKFTGSAFATR